MSNTTADQVTSHGQSRVAGTAPSPEGLPCTTVVTSALSPKIPQYVGDSWRPAAASLLGVAPLAAIAALSAMSLMGTASAASARHADASTAQVCVTTVAPVGPSQLKLPACLGD
jgi:hypothetical protein